MSKDARYPSPPITATPPSTPITLSIHVHPCPPAQLSHRAGLNRGSSAAARSTIASPISTPLCALCHSFVTWYRRLPSGRRDPDRHQRDRAKQDVSRRDGWLADRSGRRRLNYSRENRRNDGALVNARTAERKARARRTGAPEKDAGAGEVSDV